MAALANAAGVGGGAFIVPLLYVGLGLGIKDCTALSQAAIAVRAPAAGCRGDWCSRGCTAAGACLPTAALVPPMHGGAAGACCQGAYRPAPLQGGALGAVACTGRQRHPLDAARPLVDWRLALVLTPTLLLGCTTGVLFNQLLPAWGVTLLLIPLLTVLTARTAAAAARLHCAESTAAAAAAEAAAASAASLDLQEADLAPPPAAPPCADCAFPYQHAAELLALWAVLLGFQCGKHQFSPGSLEFAAVYAAQAATALSASAFFVAQAAASRRQPDAGSDCSCSADADAGSPAGAGSPGVDPLLLEAAGSDSSAWSTRQLAGASAVALAGGTVAGRPGAGSALWAARLAAAAAAPIPLR